jgi:hypothetical protein
MASLAAATIDPNSNVGKALAKLSELADADAGAAHAAALTEAIKGPEKWPAKTQTLYEVL